jgi:hypothetical protein
MQKKDLEKNNFVEFIYEFLLDFSPDGRKRILKDLKRTKSQILCSSGNLKSVSKVGAPLVKEILSKLELNESYRDIGINWSKTEGVNFDIVENRKAVKLIFLKLEEIYHTKGEELPKLFLSQLSTQNNTLIRKLSVLKYKSKKPGCKLVGKQTLNNKHKNFGYVYEHTIPIKYFIVEVIKLFNLNQINVQMDFIFSKLISVELNTDDDQLVVLKGLKFTMPNRWSWENDPLERYWISGIERDSLTKLF